MAVAPETSALEITPSLDEVRALVPEYNTVPLRQSFIDDCETPVSAFLKLRGEGEAGYGGGPQGDLYVVIHVQEHEMFVRQDNDVIIEAPISFPQAAVGTEIEVPTLDGKVKLKIPAATQSGKILRLKGKGIVDLHGYGRGDQLIKIVVETPRSLTPRQRELLEEFAKLDGKAVNHPLSKGFVDKLKEMFG